MCQLIGVNCALSTYRLQLALFLSKLSSYVINNGSACCHASKCSVERRKQLKLDSSPAVKLPNIATVTHKPSAPTLGAVRDIV